MRKMNVWITAAAMGICLAGCGQSTEQETTSAVVIEAGTEAEQAEDAAKETEDTQAQTEETETEAQTKETEAQTEAAGGYEDNFAVDSAAAADFARQIQAAVSEQDLEKLADLTAFPVYVDLPDGGKGITSREEFLQELEWSENEYRDKVEEAVMENLKFDYVTQAIAEAEGLEPSEAELMKAEEKYGAEEMEGWKRAKTAKNVGEFLVDNNDIE